jgi:hypothetical protein
MNPSSPSLMRKDSMKRIATYVVSPSQRCDAVLAVVRNVFSANLPYDLVSQFRPRHRLASWLSPASNFICDIVSLCALNQVSWIETEFYITSVSNTRLRPSAIGDVERKLMNANAFPLKPAVRIGSLGFIKRPQKAFVRVAMIANRFLNPLITRDCVSLDATHRCSPVTSVLRRSCSQERAAFCSLSEYGTRNL